MIYIYLRGGGVYPESVKDRNKRTHSERNEIVADRNKRAQNARSEFSE